MSAEPLLIVGAQAIAQELGITPRQAYELRKQGWPIFRFQGKLAVRRSKLLEHVEKLETNGAA